MKQVEVNYSLNELLELQKSFLEMQDLKTELDTRKKENESKRNPIINELREMAIAGIQTGLENVFGGKFEPASDSENVLNVGLIDVAITFNEESNKSIKIDCKHKLSSQTKSLTAALVVSDKRTFRSDVNIDVRVFENAAFEKCHEEMKRRIASLRESVDAEEYVEPKILRYTLNENVQMPERHSAEDIPELVAKILEIGFRGTTMVGH